MGHRGLIKLLALGILIFFETSASADCDPLASYFRVTGGSFESASLSKISSVYAASSSQGRISRFFLSGVTEADLPTDFQLHAGDDCSFNSEDISGYRVQLSFFQKSYILAKEIFPKFSTSSNWAWGSGIEGCAVLATAGGKKLNSILRIGKFGTNKMRIKGGVVSPKSKFLSLNLEFTHPLPLTALDCQLYMP